MGAGSRRWKIIVAPGFLATLPGGEVVEGLARDALKWRRNTGLDSG